MSELSPQAQEVFWAFNRAASGKPYDWHYLPAIAAALRAVADQVAPENYLSYTGHPEHDIALEEKNDSVRKAILAIASELEDQ
jgi:hypothetical protein